MADIAQASIRAGGITTVPLSPPYDPAGGTGLTIRDQNGRPIQLVHGGDATTQGSWKTTRCDLRRLCRDRFKS